mmetsp:Transcript_105652/g.264531  ORF Transcript_105652/g.264531 Transcript_105652/m.264531 type:complete len:285 (-) Transcript_105652:280-1134(-)
MASDGSDVTDAKCVLCGEQPHCLATHFDLCFEAHCPTSRPVVRVPLQVSRIVEVPWLGSYRIPAPAASLFSASLSVPDRLACLCASQHWNNFLNDDHDWDDCAYSQWRAFLKTATGLPDGSCGCGLSDPRTITSVSPKIKAVGLWQMRALDTITIELNNFSGINLLVDIRGVADGEGARAPVLPHVTISHLKNIYWKLEGIPHDQQRIIHKRSKQLLHEVAPLGAYTWEAFACRQFLHLDVTLQTGTRCGLQGFGGRRLAVPIEWRCRGHTISSRSWRAWQPLD